MSFSTDPRDAKTSPTHVPAGRFTSRFEPPRSRMPYLAWNENSSARHLVDPSPLGKVAYGLVCADMRGPLEGWLHVRIGENFSQFFILNAQPRLFGGRQWYFQCPVTNRQVSVVWKPDGAEQFCSRQAWGSQVAYLSRFGSRVDRAHLGKARIAGRLFEISNSEQSKLSLGREVR